VNKVFLATIVLAVALSSTMWIEARAADSNEAPKAAKEKPEEEDTAETKVSRDDKGNVVITMDDDTQGENGINVAKVQAGEMKREVKGYGRVLDPAPLEALLNELASAQAASAASSNELARLKTLAGQGNASTRLMQTGEAAALHDQLAVQSASDRLALSWGKAVMERADSEAFLKSLVSFQRALVRVDLPGAETLPGVAEGARVVSLSGNSSDGALLGPAPNVDPQTQGRGFIFLVGTNTSGLVPGQAVTGFIKIEGEPLTGAIVPSTAVVRTEGSGWVYVLQGNGEDFVRVPVSLDRPVDNGWFVTNGVSASNYVVVTGAQMLLSEESKGSAKPEP